MIKEFKLPELGENIEKAQILTVLVKPGDAVKKDDTLFELETDKATVEVPSEFEGVIESVNIKDGDEVPVGAVILTYSDAVVKQGEEQLKKEEPKSEEPVKAVAIETPELTAGIVEFRLPELGENIETAKILKTLVKPGDKVEKDQSLIELETDKATVEVPSEIEGIVKSVNVKEGDTAKVGEVIIVFETSNSERARKTSDETETVKAVEPEKAEIPKVESAPIPAASPLTPKKAKQRMSEKIAPASPSVRRFAREIGIDIHSVNGTGPGGRISVDDVKAFAKNLHKQIQRGEISAFGGIRTESLPDFSKWGEIDVQPMNNIRKKTAQHLSYAWSTVPHVTQYDKADITELERIRKLYGDKVKAAGGKLTVTSIMLKIVASALKVFPQFNASVDMQNNSIIYKKYYNIGVAVDTERGLLVPVIKDVDKKNIVELSKELTEISAKARNGKLSLDEMQGGNFSISNLGGIGGTAFSPIVNAPEVAILGISRGSYEQIYVNGKFEPRLMLPLSLSYDHRIVDGAAGARFIRWIAEALENPFLLSLEG